MRSRTVARTLVSVTAAIGIGAGGLAGASASIASPQPAATAAVNAEVVSTLAVNNLGLSAGQAKNWQCYLKSRKFNPGAIDGQLGTNSWTAAQKMFNSMGFNAGPEDGIVGPQTIRALQGFLNTYGHGLDIDGIAGAETRAAFAHFAYYACP
jgi:peptidoglycan hydrolase-like protein with peptidoglycan-binding domain